MNGKNGATRKSRPQRQHDPLATAPLGQVLSELCITDWDVAIFGDGSGSGWDTSSGWAAVLIDRHQSGRKYFNGAINIGTAYLAELFPYLHAMLWYSRGPGKAHMAGLRQHGIYRPIRVHCITDSEILANQGNGAADRKAARELWLAMDSFVTRGYQFHWHWYGRDRIGLNMLTDHLSRESRIAVSNVVPPGGTTVYDYNPDPSRGAQACQGVNGKVTDPNFSIARTNEAG